MPNVKGRIDHFAFDPMHNRLFVSALGNNTEEIIGIGSQTVVHTISGVPTPQGVAYSPETNKLFVGSDEGKLYVYDGTTFDLITGTTSPTMPILWTRDGRSAKVGNGSRKRRKSLTTEQPQLAANMVQVTKEKGSTRL